MPQLVRGGKYVFAWSIVGRDGRIRIPDEAVTEYHFSPGTVFILPGSRRSGGFALSTSKLLEKSPLATLLHSHAELAHHSSGEGELVYDRGKPYCWVKLHDRKIKIPLPTLKAYGVEAGDRLLVIRGSGLALGFAVKGPIVEEAQAHPEIAAVTCDEISEANLSSP
ncbi:MAG: hypothetical protein HXS53_12290 [Theionarchaea archaeon]|nr:hypothetical protein [Theionarchaea archaeon]